MSLQVRKDLHVYRKTHIAHQKGLERDQAISNYSSSYL